MTTTDPTTPSAARDWHREIARAVGVPISTYAAEVGSDDEDAAGSCVVAITDAIVAALGLHNLEQTAARLADYLAAAEQGRDQEVHKARALEAERDAARAERDEIQRLADLQWSRALRATDLWQAEKPEERALTWPDAGRLFDWLIERGDAARRELQQLRDQIQRIAEDVRTKPALDTAPYVYSWLHAALAGTAPATQDGEQA